MNEKVNITFSLKMLYPMERSRERCASNNLSRDNENLLLVAAFILQSRASGKDPILMKEINLL